MIHSELNAGMGFRSEYIDINRAHLEIAGASAQYPWCPKVSKWEK